MMKSKKRSESVKGAVEDCVLPKNGSRRTAQLVLTDWARTAALDYLKKRPTDFRAIGVFYLFF